MCHHVQQKIYQKIRSALVALTLLSGFLFPALAAAVTPMVSAGALHTVALKADGTVLAWGDNSQGQLGDGTTTQRTSPVAVSGLSDVVAVAAGHSHTVALKADGTVLAWGLNSDGELGNGTTTNRLSPMAVPGLTGVVALEAGGYHTVALKADGTVRAWGDNQYGQLGDGTRANRLSPVVIPGLNGVVAVTTGGSHTMALKANGTVLAWGYNIYGQLGDGTTTDRLSPAVVPGLTSVMMVVARACHTVALKSDGTVLAWGYNVYGQLGDGTTTNRSSPVTVPGLTGVAAVAAGVYHTVALKADSTVQAWGRNNYGQLGDGTTTNRAGPVAVPGLTGVVAVVARDNRTVALKAGGTLRAWGWNSYGQLGDCTTTNRTSPVAVAGIGCAGFLRLDTTPPIISSSQTPLANANGWNNNNVTVTFTATDSGYTPICTVNSVTLTAESAGQVVSTTCTDAAGNSASASRTVNIDKTAPGLVMPGFAASYMLNSSVPISFSAIETLSPPAALSATLNGHPVNSGDTVVLTQVGVNTFSLTATDKAGNSVTQTRQFTVIADTTPPVIIIKQTPLPNANGWNNSDVTVTFTATDDGSTPACTVNSVTLTAEGAEQVVSTTCTDAAGNSSSASRTVNIDKTAPAVAGTRAPAANVNGWNNTDVTVTFIATDSLSGIQGAASADVLLSGEGAGQTASTSFSDLAGNSGSATVGDINIDKTAPVLTLPSLAGSYVLNSTLTLSFAASDALSNLATQSATLNGNSINSGDTVLLSQLGTNAFTLTATDKAGNSVIETRQFAVIYAFGGFLPPLTADSRTIFHLGSVIPVKFELFDANGVTVSTAIAHLSLQQLINGDPVGDPIDATPPGGVNSGTLFRYSGEHYAYNLSTKLFSKGIWIIQATLDDGTVQSIEVGLTER